MSKDLYVKISGPPGAGKSMLARHIIQMLLQKPVPLKGACDIDDGETVTRVEGKPVNLTPGDWAPGKPDPLTTAHQTGVEATLRARIATLEGQQRAQATTIDTLQREIKIHRGNSGHFEARYKEEQGRANGLEQFKRDHPPVSINYIRDKFEKACTATTEETLLRAYLILLLDIIKGAHHV